MKIIDSNINKNWTGKGFSYSDNKIVVYKNANFGQKVSLKNGKYRIRILAKNRTISESVNIKIISDKNVVLYNTKISLNKTWKEDVLSFNINNNYENASISIYRDIKSNGSVELGRFILEYDQPTENIKQSKPVQKITKSESDKKIIDPGQVFHKYKIAFIIPYSIYGGAEVYIKEIVNNLNYDMFNVHLIYMKKNPLENMVETNKVVHKQISTNDNLKNYILSNNFEYIVYYNSAAVYKNLISIIKNEQSLRSKIIEIYHSDFKWSDSLSNLSSRQGVDILFSVSSNLGKNIEGVENRYVLPVPINIKKFSFDALKEKSVVNVDPGRKNIGVVARLSAEKNIDYVLDIAKKANKYNFLIFGDGPEEVRLKNTISLEKINNVYFFGFKKDMHMYYGNFDALLLTSKFEGTPISILEAMSAGIPVFSTGVGNIYEIVNDNVTGFIIPNNNVDKCIEILDLNIYNQKVILNAREYIEQKHDSKRVVESFITYISNLNNKYIKKNDKLILDGEYV